MSEWKTIETVADIPHGPWDKYLWEMLTDGCDWEEVKPKGLLISPTIGGLLIGSNEFYRYKEKPWPTDGFIESQVWEVRKNTWITYKAIHSQTTSTESGKVTEGVYFDTNDVMGSEMRSRVWFQDADHFPKSEVKHGVER